MSIAGQGGAGRAGPAGRDEPRALNRDASWLEFNRRVLQQALDPARPILDRVKFLAIFSSNLDEFFMKRVGLLRRQVELGLEGRPADGRSTRDVLAMIRQMVLQMQSDQARCWERELQPALREHQIHLLTYAELTDAERVHVDAWFEANVFPVLTPLAVDPGHRFPFISNLSENLGVVLTHPGQPERLFARVKVPDVLPRLVPVGPPGSAGGTRLIWLEEVITNNLDELFPGMRIEHVMAFRLTRNASVEHDEDTEDLLQSVEAELKMRRFAQAVRIEVAPGAEPWVVDLLLQALSLSPDDVYERGGPLEYGDLFQVADLDRPELREAPWRSIVPARLADEEGDLFAAIRERDILVHHPYESFTASVERFIAAAARDPDVLAIKQTLYRTTPDSPFVASLIRAAEAGKQVACLVEVRARFDESRNVRFARMLEKNGVHVAYGVIGLKTHCKCSLVVRREADGLRSYVHLGTGNYHPRTAQLYTDLGILTCDPAISQDVVDVFNLLTGRSLKREYQELVVAPHAMRDRFLSLIDGEIAVARAGGRGRIIAKMNALEDQIVSEKLYEASCAGVRIDLIVRGFCCLRPGVPGMSENIHVRSIVGRFLEHSRVFHFGQGREDPVDGVWYIGSADWMYRNLSGRVEIATPVKDRRARARIKRILDVMLADAADAWEMRPDGTYERLRPPAGAEPDSAARLGTFRTLMRETQQQAEA